ncbi:MAG: helix-turn-helix domain-containing protein [Oscillospiraceae bacterium]|nr:helix-turn-helix domain-containing protein [Oscillospiraceae bacterium]
MLEKRPDSPVGAIIKTRLKEMERSQPWLARQVDRSAGTINFIIKGRITPSVELVKSIASVLSLDNDVLLSALKQGVNHDA